MRIHLSLVDVWSRANAGVVRDDVLIRHHCER